jgi:hypothetical protein
MITACRRIVDTSWSETEVKAEPQAGADARGGVLSARLGAMRGPLEDIEAPERRDKGR